MQHEYSDDYPKGQVCFQSVNEGTKVEQGTAINLIISDGPDPNSQPVPTEVTKDVMFALPDVGAVVNVEVYDSQGNKVHSAATTPTCKAALSWSSREPVRKCTACMWKAIRCTIRPWTLTADGRNHF